MGAPKFCRDYRAPAVNELAAREHASDAYHSRPSHHRSCQSFEEFQYESRGHHERCPCEKRWYEFLLKKDDRVRRYGWGAEAKMLGTVLRVTPVKHGSGGVEAHVRIRWDSGSEGRHENRQLVRVCDDRVDQEEQ